MKCRRARALIFDVTDNAIADPDRNALEQHLVGCPACEALAKGVSASLSLLRGAPLVQPDENFNWKVRLAIAQARKGMVADPLSERVWVRSWNTRFALSALSTFVVVASAGYVFMRTTDFSRSTAERGTADQQVAVGVLPTESVSVQSGPARPASTGVRVPSTVNPSLVSAGPSQPTDDVGNKSLIDELPGMTLNTDSLTSRFRRSRHEAYRMRLLEYQIDVLQGELRKCESSEK